MGTENFVSTKKQHAFLVWDTFSGHMTNDVAKLLKSSNIAVTVIRSGCTSKIPLLDVCLNKPFKDYCRSHWVEYMQQQVTIQEPGEKIKPASKQQVIDWIVQSNNLLGGKKDVVHNLSLSVAYLIHLMDPRTI